MKKILAPSILAGDHSCLKDSLISAEQDGRSWIHLDIMDGHFVPNLSFGSSNELRRGNPSLSSPFESVSL